MSSNTVRKTGQGRGGLDANPKGGVARTPDGVVATSKEL